MSKYSDMLREFHEAFAPITVDYRKLIREEFNEFCTEVEDNGKEEDTLKELCDLLYVATAHADMKKWGDIERNEEEITLIRASFEKYQEKYPDVNIKFVTVATAYIEFVTSNDFLWLYRLAQGIFAYADSMQWPIQSAFTRVHESNMSKLEDGKVVRREDGKVLKGANYKPADLKELLAIKPKEKKPRAKKKVVERL